MKYRNIDECTAMDNTESEANWTEYVGILEKKICVPLPTGHVFALNFLSHSIV